MTPSEIKIEVLDRTEAGRSNRLRTKTTLRFGRVSIFVLALILTFLPYAFAQTARKGRPVRSVKRSNIISEVSERAKQSPSLTPVELAAYGNDRIARKGFDYRFDICDLLNDRDPASSSPAAFMHNYQMTLTEGGKLTFRFRNRKSL